MNATMKERVFHEDSGRKGFVHEERFSFVKRGFVKSCKDWEEPRF